MELASLPDAVGNLSATAVLGWYAWYTAARAIPALVRAFREEQAAARADHRAQIESLRQELALLREESHADHLALVAALGEVTRHVAHSL